MPAEPADAVATGEPFTAEHESLRAAARRFVEGEITPKATDWEADDGLVPDELFRRLADAGLCGLAVPAELGGQGGDGWAELVLWQEVGRGRSMSAAQALAAHALDGIGLLAAFAPEAPELAAALDGTGLLATALGGDVTATATGGGWSLAGTADLVVGGLRAHTLLVEAATDDGQRIVLVVKATAGGITRTRVDTVGLRGTDLATIEFADVAVDAAAWLASADDAHQLLDARRWLHAALAVGEARTLVEEAFAYAAEREVFGRRLDSFQVQQHRLVNLATMVEATHRLVHDVADRAIRSTVRPDEVARLDLAARHLVAHVADESLQLHGGYGYSQEYRVQQSWRDAAHLRAGNGGDDARRDRLAALVLDLPTALGPDPVDANARLPLFDAGDLAAQARARELFRSMAPSVHDWERDEDYPREVFAELGQAGLLGMMASPAHGGTGRAPLRRMAVIAATHELGSGGLSADLGAHSDLAMVYVATTGSDEQCRHYVATGAAGTSIGSLGITEPAAGSNVAGIQTRAVATDDGWLLRGTKHFITGGAWADWMVVVAKTSVDLEKPHRGISLFVVDLDRPGITRRRMKMLGWRASHTGEISFDDVFVPREAMLGEEGTGFLQIMVNFAWERLSMSWGAVNSAESLLRRAAAAAAEVPVADGRMLRDHDAWRHRLAELAARIAQGRAMTEHALRLYVFGADLQQQNRATAMAKLMTQTLLFDVADELLATLGARGLRRDAVVERHWRDSRLGPIGGGTDEIMREILVKAFGLH